LQLFLTDARRRLEPAILNPSAKTQYLRPTADGLGQVLTVLAGSALGYAAAAAIWLQRLAGYDLHYNDTRLPMLTEADGYFHLFRSQELLAGKAAWLQEPALSVVGALLQLVTRLPLELIAFWLPAVLGLASGIWFWAWGKLLRAPLLQTALAACIGSLVPVWFWRASPGWYDTDPGIVFLFHGCLYATARLGLSPGRPRLPHALLLGLSALALAWWWRPGGFLLPLCLLLWGATFPLAKDPVWRRARLATLAALCLGGVFFLLLPALLPAPVLHAREYLMAHAAMLREHGREAVFASINELSPSGFLDVLAGLGGNAATGVLALCCVLLLCWRHPRECVFFLPSFLAVGMTVFATRFLFFAALPVALGVGLLPGMLPELLSHPRLGAARLPGKFSKALALLVVAAILAGSIQVQRTCPLKLYFQEPQDRLALALKRFAPPEAQLWNWWDDGYFLAARSGHAPLFDGGSQTPRMAYIAAHPLLAEDPLFARRWIRFFALRGKEAALEPLRAAWGDDATVWKHLDEVFAAADPAAALAALPPLAPGAGWLLPQGRVFLYLPQRFLKITTWWMGLGSAPDADARTFRAHVDVFERTLFRFNPALGQVILPQEAIRKGYTDFGGVYLTNRTPLAPPWGGGKPGPYVVTSDLTPWLYIVDELALRSVGFRLLAPGGAALPGFAPVLVNYAYGGLWEVLP
jgi:hypothetical protein